MTTTKTKTKTKKQAKKRENFLILKAYINPLTKKSRYLIFNHSINCQVQDGTLYILQLL